MTPRFPLPVPASPEGPDEGLREPFVTGPMVSAVTGALLQQAQECGHTFPPDVEGYAYAAADAVLPLLTAERERADHRRCYTHPDCGFHWHGKDGLDVPTCDGEPECPRCALSEARERADRLARDVARLCDEAERASGNETAWVPTGRIRAALSATDPEPAGIDGTVDPSMLRRSSATDPGTLCAACKRTMRRCATGEGFCCSRCSHPKVAALSATDPDQCPHGVPWDECDILTRGPE